MVNCSLLPLYPGCSICLCWHLMFILGCFSAFVAASSLHLALCGRGFLSIATVPIAIAFASMHQQKKKKMLPWYMTQVSEKCICTHLSLFHLHADFHSLILSPSCKSSGSPRVALVGQALQSDLLYKIQLGPQPFCFQVFAMPLTFVLLSHHSCTTQTSKPEGSGFKVTYIVHICVHA